MMKASHLTYIGAIYWLAFLLHHTTLGATLSQQAMMGMPQVIGLDAKCGRSGMTVHVSFNLPFTGVIYSKGFYSQRNCQYVSEKNTGRTNYTFLIPVNGCGTDGQLEEPTPTRDMYYQNTIIIQLDPLITEVWDEAHSLKCLWPHSLMRSVKTAPIKVVDPEYIDVELNENSVNTLMQVQRGRSLLRQEVTGYVYMGEQTSLVFYVHDENMDANVINCTASSDAFGGKIEELIDQFGCVRRPDLITYFDKTKTSNGIKADLMLYAYLKGLQLNEKSKFSIKCQLQMCKKECITPCVNGPVIAGRRKRSVMGGLESKLDAPNSPDHAILIVEKEKLKVGEGGICSLSSSVLISGIVLLLIIVFLSLLSCYLAVRLFHTTSSDQK